MKVVDTGNSAVLGYWREMLGEPVLCLLNLTNREQVIALDIGDRIDRNGNIFDGIHVRPHTLYQLVARRKPAGQNDIITQTQKLYATTDSRT